MVRNQRGLRALPSRKTLLCTPRHSWRISGVPDLCLPGIHRARRVFVGNGQYFETDLLGWLVGRLGNRRRPRFPARNGAAAAEQVNLSWKKCMRHDYTYTTRWHLIVLMPNNVWNSSGRVFSRLLKANNCA